MHSRHHVNLIAALPAEAKPLIRAFGLKRQQPVGPIPLYTAPGVHLVVSGTGVAAMEAGVTYLRAMTPAGMAAGWLNLGICGHGSLRLGEALLVDRVIAPGGRSWELITPSDMPFQRGPLTCVTQPQAVYEPQMAYDMESAGFLASVTRFAPMNNVSVLKIVSDNPEHGVETINAKRVRDLIAHHVDHILDLMHRLPLND